MTTPDPPGERGRPRPSKTERKPAAADLPRKGYKPAEIAAMFDRSLPSVRAHIASGEIPSFAFGRRRLVPAAWVERMNEGTLEEFIARTRRTSGVPATVEDPTALHAVGAILDTPTASSSKSGRPTGAKNKPKPAPARSTPTARQAA